MAKFNPITVIKKQSEDKRANLSSLPLSDIFPDPQNDHIYEVNEEQDQALMQSIQEHGVLQPLLLRPHPTLPSKFMIVAGHRRFKAATDAGLQTVPVMVLNATGDKQETIRSKIQFIETNALTRVSSVQEKMAMMIELEKSYQLMRDEDESIRGIPTRQLVAQSMGISERQVADYMTVRNGLSDDDWDDWHRGNLSLTEALKRVTQSKDEVQSIEDKQDDDEAVDPTPEKPLKKEKVLILKNDEERKAFLDTWPTWKVLCRVPKINLVVREYVLPDESKILSYDFGAHPLYYCQGEPISIRQIEHKQLIKKGGYASFDRSSTTELITHLKEVVPRKAGIQNGTS